MALHNPLSVAVLDSQEYRTFRAINDLYDRYRHILSSPQQADFKKSLDQAMGKVKALDAYKNLAAMLPLTGDESALALDTLLKC